MARFYIAHVGLAVVVKIFLAGDFGFQFHSRHKRTQIRHFFANDTILSLHIFMR